MKKLLSVLTLIFISATFSVVLAQDQEEEKEDSPFGDLGGILEQIIKPKVEAEKPNIPEINKVPPPQTCYRTDDCDGDSARSYDYGGSDCDDFDANRYPGNIEVADAAHHDEDCDPQSYGEVDFDEDGHFDAAACNVMQDGSLHCGTDCDDTNYAIIPGAQQCASQSQVKTCKKSPFQPYSGGDQIGWDNGHWETSACPRGCSAQPNGTGVCR